MPTLAPGSPFPGARGLAGALLLLGACTPEPAPSPLHAPIGEPVPGLDATQLERFRAGQALFGRIFTEADGLGPRFNENACNACHTDPADGGTGEQLVVKAAHQAADGTCDVLAAQGGENVRAKVTPRAAALGAAPAETPAEANTRGRLNTPFLFGVGLMDLIPQADLEARADPDDRDGDGISGRLGQDAQGRPARFGRKAGTASLAGFVDEAFRFEMGLTTATVPDEAQAGDRPGLPEGADPTGEPEVDEGTASLVTDFVRWLAPPAPGTASPADEEAVRQGEALFEGLGCARCHTPQQRTAASAPPPLAGRAFALYSDLLLHDMGPDLESACTASATSTEHRTEPLIGLRYRRRFLHDGRATRVRDAILAHGGEADAARTAFAALDRVTQEAVLRFLGTL